MKKKKDEEPQQTGSVLVSCENAAGGAVNIIPSMCKKGTSFHFQEGFLAVRMESVTPKLCQDPGFSVVLNI